MLARFRYHLQLVTTEADTILCEEIVPLAATGSGDQLVWLDPAASEALLDARPEQNLTGTAIQQQIGLLAKQLPALQQALVPLAQERAAAQLQAHQRVRTATRSKGKITIQPVLPVDLLGAYILLPRIPG